MVERGHEDDEWPEAEDASDAATWTAVASVDHHWPEAAEIDGELAHHRDVDPFDMHTSSTPPRIQPAEPEFTIRTGYISAGGDLHVEVMTVAAARLKCAEMPECRGFCFKGPDSLEAVKVFFKDKFDVQGEGWTAYCRLAVAIEEDYFQPGNDRLFGSGAPENPEARILALQREEGLQGSLGNAQTSELALRFADLFEHLNNAAADRVRKALDSNLVFRRDGSAVDLRSLVFKALSEQDRGRVLAQIARLSAGRLRGTSVGDVAPALPAPGGGGVAADPERPPLIVISDVDDTLLPAADALGIGGQDRSWTRDGRVYPGVARLHRELRGGNPPDAYSVLLTARPPKLCADLMRKLPTIAGVATPRMAILPGPGGVEAVRNVTGILGGDYTDLGKKKVARLREYVSLFPEKAGSFALLGDDGQADLQVASEMLALVDPSTGVSMVAFVAIHAVQTEAGFVVPSEEQRRWVQLLRSAHPPVPRDFRPRQRFFYFGTYEDLAEQLAVDGWLSPLQCGAVIHSADRDRSFRELTAAVATHDMLALATSLRIRFMDAHELDEVEVSELGAATAAMPQLAAAHVLLTGRQRMYSSGGPKAADMGNSALAGGLEISVTGLRWPLQPFLAVRCDERSSSSHAGWEGSGELLACPGAAEELMEGWGRLVVTVFSAKPLMRRGTTASTFVGRFYIALQPAAGSSAHGTVPAITSVCAPGGETEVALLGAQEEVSEAFGSFGYSVPATAGHVMFSFRWT